MQIDELRGELTSLSDEMDAFRGDVDALHSRQRHRRVLRSSLVAVLVVAVAASSVAINRHHHAVRVQVESIPTKEVGSDGLTRIDAIVVPAVAGVQEVLDASPLVLHYAHLPRGFRAPSQSLLVPADLAEPLCALESDDGYALQMTAPAADRRALRDALGGRATLYDVSNALGFDFELFLKVGASEAVADAMRARLKSDAEISRVTFLNRADAYEAFKKDFANQPALIHSTKPSDLPESFRVDVVRGASVTDIVRRFEHLPDVDIVITPTAGNKTLFAPATSSKGATTTGSTCPKVPAQTKSASFDAPQGFTTVGDATGTPVGWARSDLLTPDRMDQADYRAFVTPERLIPVTGPNGKLVGYVAYDYGFVSLAEARAPGFDIVKARIARDRGCMDPIGIHDPSEHSVPTCGTPKP